MTPRQPIRARAPWPEQAAVRLQAADRPARLPWRPLSLGWRRARRPVQPARFPAVTLHRDPMMRFALSIAYRWDVSLHMVAAADNARPFAPEAFRSRLQSGPASLLWARPFPVSARQTLPGGRHRSVRTIVPNAPPDHRVPPRTDSVAPPAAHLYHWHAALATRRRLDPAVPQPGFVPRSATTRKNAPPPRLAWRLGVATGASPASPVPRNANVARGDFPPVRPPLALTLRASVRGPTEHAQALAAAPRRAVALSWRDAAAPRDASALVSARPTPLAAPAPHYAASATTPARSSPPPSLSRSAQSLDPAIAERLVDDVIRRVDRRMRITRERRGI